jgi:hypothetical protein
MATVWAQRAAIGALCLVAVACGHRGDPRPPIFPAPPPITRITISQVGTDAVIRFPLPPEITEAGNDTIEITTIEGLVFTERYPVLDIELLATALERHRRLIIEDAVLAAEAAAEAERLEAIRAQYEDPDEGARAVARAQEEAQEAAEEEESTVRDEEDRLIFHIASDVRDEWRAEGITPEVILATARNLNTVANTVWEELGLPTTVLDPNMPMALPDIDELTELAGPMLEEISYERQVPVEIFVTRAGAPARISYEEAQERVVDDLVEIVYPVGIPAPDEFRTRYFFSARARTSRNAEGEVRTIRSLAPSPVPLSPMEVTVDVGYELRPVPVPLLLPVLIPGEDDTQPPGVNVSWTPPPGDVWGRFIDRFSLVYNVYRTKIIDEIDPEAPEPSTVPTETDPAEPPVEPEIEDPDAPATADEPEDAPDERSSLPLNQRPISSTRFIDRTMEWGERYVYEVRAMIAPPIGPGVRESAGAPTAVIEAVDTFPPDPPTELQIVRAGSQVRLQWRPATAPDLLGYRVYRHPLPAPEFVADSWEEITPEPVGATRFLDSSTESGVTYAYAVVSVDQKGNTSEPLIAEEPGAFEE